MDYYYLIAQLPSLAYGQAVPMSSADYLELCASQLSPEDFKAMQTESGADFFRAWDEWNGSLVKNLARYRAAKLKRDAAGIEATDYPFDAATAAKSATAMESPLEAELFLDGARWNCLSNLEGLDPFGLSKVFSYYYKLRLMERRQAFNAEAGFGEYQRLYKTILDKKTMEKF
jgi:hypothetical protein